VAQGDCTQLDMNDVEITLGRYYLRSGPRCPLINQEGRNAEKILSTRESGILPAGFGIPALNTFSECRLRDFLDRNRRTDGNQFVVG